MPSPPDGRPLWLESQHRDFVAVHGRYMPREVTSVEEKAGGIVKLARLRVTSYRPEPDTPFEPAREPGSVWRFWRGHVLELTEIIPGGTRDHLEELVTRLRGKSAIQPAPPVTTSAWVWRPEATTPFMAMLGLCGMAAWRRGRRTVDDAPDIRRRGDDR